MISLNKTLALILWSKDENGEDEVAVFSGVLIKKNETFFLEREDKKNPMILEEWLPRIDKIPEDLKEMLMGCEYQLTLSVGDIDDTPELYESFGLTWTKS
ncbi:MAG: hypothetical protein H6Q35_1000 [Proteobacteria bacterium]|nr:hypothetical protein [Pseudomonadota bacterium]